MNANSPMQFLGPAEKGIYANGCLPWLFSGRNRSGLNSSGAGHTSEFLWRARVATPTEVPLGAVYPSTKQHKSCQTVRFQAKFISQALSEQYFQDNKNLIKQTNWPPELIVSQKNGTSTNWGWVHTLSTRYATEFIVTPFCPARRHFETWA